MRVEKREETNAEEWPDRELVQRMRRDEPAAIREFYRRFAPALWKQARRARLHPAARDDAVTDCLSDAAMFLMRPAVPIPANLAGYLVAALRNRLVNEHRTARRRSAHDEPSAAAAQPDAGERVVREACSEATLRASAGPADEPPPLSPVLVRLFALIEHVATDEERRLMRWLAARVPHTLIAGWLGITPNAARVRALRLRDRLMGIALQAGVQWAPDERRELHAFLRRCGCLERARRVAERSRGSPRPVSGSPGAGRGSSQEEQ